MDIILMIASAIFPEVDCIPPVVSYPCGVAHYFHAEVGAPELVPCDNCFQWLEVDRLVTDWCESILNINKINHEITTLF